MTLSLRERGDWGEDEAVRFLEARGFVLIERNWRPGKIEGSRQREGAVDGAMRGEIDCIAWQGKVLCFIEVKARSSNNRGAPQEAVTRSKQRQISRLANAYVSLHKLHDTPCRFDVVEVWLNQSEPPRLVLHLNAFDYQSSGEASRGRGSRVF